MATNGYTLIDTSTQHGLDGQPVTVARSVDSLGNTVCHTADATPVHMIMLYERKTPRHKWNQLLMREAKDADSVTERGQQWLAALDPKWLPRQLGYTLIDWLPGSYSNPDYSRQSNDPNVTVMAVRA